MSESTTESSKFFGVRDEGPCMLSMAIGAALVAILIAIPFQCSNDDLRAKNRDMRAKAVELNAAEWKINPKTGSTTFAWKEKPVEKP